MATELGLENAEAKYCLPQTCNNYHELTFRLRRIKGEKSCKFPFTNILKNIGKSFPKAVQLQNLRRNVKTTLRSLLNNARVQIDKWYFRFFLCLKAMCRQAFVKCSLLYRRSKAYENAPRVHLGPLYRELGFV